MKRVASKVQWNFSGDQTEVKNEAEGRQQANPPAQMQQPENDDFDDFPTHD